MGRLLLLFIIVPALELFLLLQLGAYVGPLPTFALVVLTGMVGAYLARRQGLSVLGAAQAQMRAGELPAGSLADGVMIVIAGALLMTPGILTDGVGFLLLVPRCRAFVKGQLRSRFQRAVDENRVKVHFSGDDFDIPRSSIIDVEPDRYDPDRSGSGDAHPPKYKVH